MPSPCCNRPARELSRQEKGLGVSRTASRSGRPDLRQPRTAHGGAHDPRSGERGHARGDGRFHDPRVWQSIGPPSGRSKHAAWLCHQQASVHDDEATCGHRILTTPNDRVLSTLYHSRPACGAESPRTQHTAPSCVACGMGRTLSFAQFAVLRARLPLAARRVQPRHKSPESASRGLIRGRWRGSTKRAESLSNGTARWAPCYQNATDSVSFHVRVCPRVPGQMKSPARRQPRRAHWFQLRRNVLDGLGSFGSISCRLGFRDRPIPG